MIILLVEDNTEIAESLQDSLKKSGFAVDLAFDGERGLALAKLNDYDVIILDKGLPKKDGLEVCANIRSAGKDMPILILSVTTDTSIKAEALNAGADDYMTKPFSFAELNARIHALLRRPKKIHPIIFELDNVTIDVGSRKVIRNGRHIHVTAKEFSVLEYLLRNRGQVITQTELLEHVWGLTANALTNTVGTHILNIRKKLGDRKAKTIRTVSNAGYMVD